MPNDNLFEKLLVLWSEKAFGKPSMPESQSAVSLVFSLRSVYLRSTWRERKEKGKGQRNVLSTASRRSNSIGGMHEYEPDEENYEDGENAMLILDLHYLSIVSAIVSVIVSNALCKLLTCG